MLNQQVVTSQYRQIFFARLLLTFAAESLVSAMGSNQHMQLVLAVRPLPVLIVTTACSRLSWVSLVEIGKVVPQNVAQSSKLGCTLVCQAELESSSSSHCIQGLQPCIVPQDVQHCSVSLPQELEPRCDMLTINTILQHASGLGCETN